MSSLPATIHDMQRREFFEPGEDDEWLMGSANELAIGGTIREKLLSLSENRPPHSTLRPPKSRHLPDLHVVISDPSTGNAEVLVTYDAACVDDIEDATEHIQAHQLVDRILLQGNLQGSTRWMQPTSVADPVKHSDAHLWLSGFMQINQCKSLIASLDASKYSEVVDRLYFLLRRSRDKSQNQLLNARALSRAIQAISSVQLLPVAIGMDDSGELEVIWENERTGASVTVDFLVDGTAWYDVESEDCEKSDTIDAIHVVSAISNFLI